MRSCFRKNSRMQKKLHSGGHRISGLPARPTRKEKPSPFSKSAAVAVTSRTRDRGGSEFFQPGAELQACLLARLAV
jgi:hypothetical protein